MARNRAFTPDDDQRCGSCGRYGEDCECIPSAPAGALAGLSEGDRITVTGAGWREEWVVTVVTAEGIDGRLRHLPVDENPHRAAARAKRATTAYAIEHGLVQVRAGWDNETAKAA